MMAADVFEKVGKSFREHIGGKPIVWGLIFLSIAVLILLGVLIRYFTSPEYRALKLRRSLFRQLADASELTGEERDVLRMVATHYQIDDPIQVFLKRSLFEAAQQVLRIDSSLADSLRRKLYT